MNKPPIIIELVSLLLIAIAIVCSVKPTFKWWRRRPWKIKGLSLRGAEVIVESIVPVPSPPTANDYGSDTQLRYYYEMNVVIKPVGRFNKIPWMPFELHVVPAERWHPDLPYKGELSRYCRIESRELVIGEISFEPEEAFTVIGQFNLRFGISARHDIRILQFRYYVEEFGAFMLPDPVLAVHAGNDSLAATQPMINGG